MLALLSSRKPEYTYTHLAVRIVTDWLHLIESFEWLAVDHLNSVLGCPNHLLESFQYDYWSYSKRLGVLLDMPFVSGALENMISKLVCPLEDTSTYKVGVECICHNLLMS